MNVLSRVVSLTALAFILGTTPIHGQTPQITSLSPDSAVAGGLSFTLTVIGVNFGSGSVVYWNGIALPSVPIPSETVSATVNATYITYPGTSQITVSTPGLGVSASVLFRIVPAPSPTPSITTLVPSSAAVGGPAFDLQVNGSNFIPESVVQWNGSSRFTLFLSSKQLRASILSADIGSPGPQTVTVRNAAGISSNPVQFLVMAAGPTITALSPPAVQAGSSGFTLSVSGMNFVQGSVVRCNSTNRSTVFLNNNSLQATIPSTDVALAGSLSITVRNPDESTSGAKLLTVVAISDVKREPADGGLPGACVLEQNYPNPFNPTTVIRYGVPARSVVRLTLYNTLGQEVRILVNGEEEAGYHEVQIDAAGLTSGVYLCRLQSGESVQSRKLLLLK